MKYRTSIKFILLLLIALFVVSHFVFAQDTYEEWKKQYLKEYQEFVDKHDAEFKKMLDQRWVKVTTDGTKKLYDDIKENKLPEVIPTQSTPAKSKEIKVLMPDKPRPVIVPKKEKPKEKQDNSPVNREQANTSTITPIPLQFVYLGDRYQFKAYDEFKKIKLKQRDNKGISEFFETLAKINTQPVIESLQSKKAALDLNDWAYGKLIQRYSEQIYPDNKDQTTLLTWYLLLKSGIEAKVAFNKKALYLLLPAQQQLFGVTYFTLDKVKYYLIDFDIPGLSDEQIYTYNGAYPGETSFMNLETNRWPSIKNEYKTKTLSFNFREKEYSISIEYNQGFKPLLEYYPQTDLYVYATAGLHEKTKQTLYPQLNTFMENLSLTEKVNFLLRFVQAAFPYKTDEDQFGREKYMFTEEIFMYPYSDCEDRAIFFANLVKDLLKLEVVGVRYPGHLATAVALPDQIQGNYLTLKNKRYYICDPTYLRADAGMEMPKFSNSKPEITPLFK